MVIWHEDEDLPSSHYNIHNLDNSGVSHRYGAGRLNGRKEVVEPSQLSNLPRRGKRNIMADHNDAAGMRGYRSRNKDGTLRDKRDDTHIGTIEKQYGVELPGRSDMHLGTYLKKHNIKSLNDLIAGS